MESKHQTIQTVLLIDSFNPGTLSEKDLSKKNKAISLTSFRILTHLQSLITWDDSRAKARSDKGLKWSYKFFNSRSYKSATKQDKFRDFKLRYFEQYESKLEETIQTTKEKIAKTSKLCPAECLQKALTEIVTDIEWEIPDITSPMKGRRHVKQQPRSSGNQNAVFLFSDLPYNSQGMRMFAGKRVLDADILLDAIMPPHLYEQFHNNSKISLFWIDISSLNPLQTEDETMNVADIKCMEIVSHTLDRIKGSALKIETVINMVNSNIKIDTETTAKSESSNSQKSQEKNSFDKQKHCVNLLSMNFPSDAIVKNMKPVRLKDAEHNEHLYQNCNLIFGKESSFEKISLKCEPLCLSNKSQKGQSKTTETRLMKLQQRKGEDNPETVTITQPQELENILNDQLEFTVHSFMSKSSLHLLSLTGATSFSVSLHGQGEITHAQAFEELLRNLSEMNNFMVLTVKLSTGKPCPVLALMEFLTSHSGVISLLPLGATLQLEKACLSETESSSSNETSSHEGSSTWERLASVCTLTSSSLRSKLSSRSPRRKHKNASADYNPQVLNSWHLPGTSKGLTSLISKLNNRLEDLTFLTGEEKQTLKRLQKMYRKENQPPALQQNSGQHSLNSHTQPDGKPSEEGQLSVEVGKRKNSKLNRGLMMVSRSKAAVKRHSKTEEEIEASQAGKTSKQHVDVTNLDLLSEESLCVYVRDVYSASVDRGEGLETAVQNMVTVTVHFLKDKGDNPEIQAVELLRRELVLSNSALREKYQEKTSDLDKSTKITEYKLQVLLLLEMESAVLSADDSHIDKCADEIVSLLRTLSFITDSGFVPNFLNKDILTSYSSTLPRLLVSVYDELMQPLPQSLAMFASPNKSADSSVMDTSLQSVDSLQDPGSSKSDILQSNRTLRNRKLVQHPSLSDYGSKKRIMVMNKPTAKTKDKAKDKDKEKEKLKRQKSAQPTTKPKKNKGKEEIVKVRRNLFEGDKPKLERRQSVAVMERTRKSPFKRNLDLSFKSPKATKSPGSKRRSVAETPAHKQKWNAVWNRQEKKRKRTSTEEDVEVVQESPMKQEHMVEASPSRNKHAVNMMRRSFYSAGPRSRSRNLTKYFQFADKIAGRQQRLSVGDAPGSQPRLPLPHKSPSRSSFLMSQLLGSPSPRHKTPSKSSTATTPKRVVAESPYSTRSRTPMKFSKILSFDSPKKSMHVERKKIIDSPSKHHRTPKKNQGQHVLCPESPGPITRSRTPSKIKSSPSEDQNAFPVSSHDIRIPSTPKRTPHRPSSTPLLRSPSLAPPLTPQRSILKNSHSSTKHTQLPSTPQRTPKADRLLSEPEALVSESPCHNTRSRNSTPSRTSVCTALFMKSPRGTPRSKLFGEIETRSPKRRVHFDSIEETSIQSGDADVDRQILQQKPVESVTNLSFVNKDGSVTALCMKSSPTLSQKTPEVQKTPSPRKTQKVTTPESFDKWPRRKRRWASPTQTSVQKENLNIGDLNSDSDLPFNTKHDSNSSSTDNSQELKRRVISRKRSFHESVQDSDTVYSSNKRSKTFWTDSLSSNDALDTRYCLHRRITSTVSKSEDLPSSLTSSLTSSQTSGVEMDYFSATNDEVFLTSDSQTTDSQSLTSSQLSSVRCQNSGRAASPVFGTNVSRILQDTATQQSPSSQGFDVCPEEDPQSPTFKTSPVLNKSSKVVSPKSKSVSRKPKTDFVSPSRLPVPDNQSKTPPLQMSPKGRSVASSPLDKKFSPSVSARSLVHLMNSPLIQPDGSVFNSPDRRDNLSGRSHFKSRKSLNMQH